MVFNVGNKKNFSLNLNELEVEEFLFDFLKALIGFIGIRNQHWTVQSSTYFLRKIEFLVCILLKLIYYMVYLQEYYQNTGFCSNTMHTRAH